MSEKKIVVPDGMIQAAEQALSVDQDQFRRWLTGDVEVPCPGANGYPLLLMLRAALRWLSENPIVPTKEQVCETLAPVQIQSPSTFSLFTEAWQRRMFFGSPEPKVPEAIKDLLYMAGTKFGCDGEPKEALPLTVQSNRRVLEAYKRGQKEGNKCQGK